MNQNQNAKIPFLKNKKNIIKLNLVVLKKKSNSNTRYATLRIKLQVKLDVIRIILFIRGGG